MLRFRDPTLKVNLTNSQSSAVSSGVLNTCLLQRLKSLRRGLLGGRCVCRSIQRILRSCTARVESDDLSLVTAVSPCAPRCVTRSVSSNAHQNCFVCLVLNGVVPLAFLTKRWRLGGCREGTRCIGPFPMRSRRPIFFKASRSAGQLSESW